MKYPFKQCYQLSNKCFQWHNRTYTCNSYKRMVLLMLMVALLVYHVCMQSLFVEKGYAFAYLKIDIIQKYISV